ncbi:alpha/beta fold hydrolase [Marinilabiliaceae bacterium ANBcel2]|nr:alpha/beta fold hydrolase [Marinilabiliaceae bacterium ANBcel2]
MQLFYRKFGTKEGSPVLIILHGLYGSSDNWISLARELESYFTVIIPDLRNHGNSFHSKIHSYEAMADDLYDLLESFPDEKFIIMGHSMGGKVAMRFALKYPELLENLIVVDIAPVNYNKTYSIEVSSKHELILEAMQKIDPSKFKNRKSIESELRLKVSDAMLPKFLLKNVKRNKEGTFFWRLNLQTLIDSLPELMDGFSKEAHSSNVPVVFIKGENSPYIMDDYMTHISRIFPDNQLVTIPDSGHLLHIEQPELFFKTFIYITDLA